MKNRKHRTAFFWMIGVLIGVWFVTGCGGETIVKKDPFFEKWKTLEQTSTGSSPVATPRKVDIGDTVSKSIPDQTPPKSLPTVKISLKMNADVKSVLRSMARSVDLNILIKDDIKGEVSLDFKAIPWDQAFNSILRTYGLTYIWEGDILRVLSLGDRERDLKQKTEEMNAKWIEKPLPPVVVPIEYAKPEDIMENLNDILTKDKEGKPKGSIKVDKHNNALIISAIAEDLQSMMSIIEKIDKPTHQIMIKANIVEATKDTARNLGVQWGGMWGQKIGSQGLYVTPGGTGGSAVPPGYAFSGVNPSATTAGYVPTSGVAGISGQGYGVNFPAAGMSPSGAGSLGLIFGTIGGNILEVQLQALQNDGKVNILSSPSITTLDNQMAYTENGQRVPYVTTTSTATGTTRDVKYEDVVLRLEIKPHVIGEKNLKMEIFVKKNEIGAVRPDDGNPYIWKKETKTTLIVKDGETIVISGLTKQKSADSESGIPWLKNIPGLGWLFRSSAKSESMEEVLIFITPTILPPQAVAAAQPPADSPVEKGK